MRIDILGGMGMETKEKAVQAQTGAAKGKKSRKKVWAVVIGVLLAVIVVAIAFIELSTLPRKDIFKAIESDLHKISKKSGSVKNFTKFCKVKLKLTTVLPLSVIA